MKHKLFYLSLFATLSIQTTLHAECIDLSLDYTAADIQAIITDYKVNATTITADSYEVCFINEFETDAAFTITSAGNDKLILKNLKIKDTATPFISGTTLLTVSGANTTIDGGFFVGNGSGTAIQVNGTNVEIKNSTFEKFEKGIVVGENGSVKLSKNTYALIPENIYNGAVTSPINKAGKYLNKENPSKVDYVVGEMDASVCSSNVGSIEMYLEPSKMTDYFVTYHNTAKCSAPAFLTEDVTLEYADKHKETLKKDVTCAFKCENLNDTTEKPITFTYTTADGITNDFAPMPVQKYVDLPSVISVMGPMSLPNTVSETDGGTTETTDTNTLSEIPGIIIVNSDPGSGQNTGDPKATTGGSGDSGGGDGGPVSQGSGACSVVGVMGEMGRASSATTTLAGLKSCATFLLALFGFVPIAWRRYSKR